MNTHTPETQERGRILQLLNGKSQGYLILPALTLISPIFPHFFSLRIISLIWTASVFSRLHPIFLYYDKNYDSLYSFVPLLVYLWWPHLAPSFRVKTCGLLSSCLHVLYQNVPNIKLRGNPSHPFHRLYAAISLHHFWCFSKFPTHVIIVTSIPRNCLLTWDFRKPYVKCPAT